MFKCKETIKGIYGDPFILGSYLKYELIKLGISLKQTLTCLYLLLVKPKTWFLLD